MPRLLILVLGLLLTIPCWTVPPKDTDPAATAKIVAEIYRMAGPRVGCTFIEPSIVLVLGGVKASNGGWANISPPEKADVALLQRISSEILEPRGMQILPYYDTKEKRLNFEVRSLRGLERVLANTRLLSQKVVAPTRLQGWTDCQKRTEAALEKHLGSGKREGWRELFNGAPDICIQDTVTYYTRGRKGKIIEQGPSLRDYYAAPQPIFQCLEANAQDPSITQTTQAWDDFLKAVYDAPECKALTQSAAFKSARIEHLEHWDNWMDQYRSAGKVRRVSRERDRWGISVK